MAAIPPRIGAVQAAGKLIELHGTDIALREAIREKAKARRARCRRRFQLWATIAAEIEAFNSSGR